MQIIMGLVAALSAVASVRLLVHVLQLESYQLPGYRRAVWRNPLRVWWPGAACSLVNLAVVSFAARVVNRMYVEQGEAMSLRAEMQWILGAALICLAVAGAAHWIQRKLPAKKPLVFTPRTKRLYGMILLVSAVLSVAWVYGLRWVAAAVLLLPALSPFLVALGAVCVSPVEKAINRGYFKDAQKRLAERPELIKVGITGSYGKTSTKFMLATILGEKYKTLATPSSFNVPMSVTRIIREQLQPEHEVFIAEMGARHVGDIKEMCELVGPKYGILTSVGPQHLETFFTQENITNTKYELIEALPEDGAAVFPADGDICEALYAKTEKPKHLAGDRAEGKGMTAEEVQVGPWGSRFTLVSAEGERAACQTRLLGAHNIQNLLLACTMAGVLGLTLEEIAKGVEKIEPVEHRLQLVPTGNGVTVIDDAYNSNPAGAAAALAVLKEFPGRRILVTPGMVELGAEEDAFNREFGKGMVGAVDQAVLIGPRHTEPIAEGLKEAGFDMACVHRVSSLEESKAVLATLLQAGDTVLFENDLPDNYQE